MENPAESSSTTPNRRRVRDQVAAQACDVCRARRTKCDEKRPQCGYCRRHNLECRYAERFAVRIERVDNTVAHLSDRVTKLEAMMSTQGSTNSTTASSTSSTGRAGESRAISQSTTASGFENSTLGGGSSFNQASERLTVPHRIFLWPSVQSFLGDSNALRTDDLANITRDGTKWFLQREVMKHPQPLPSDDNSPSTNDHWPITNHEIQEYTSFYFRTFNLLLPVLDYDMFVHTTLTRLSREGYKYEDPEAVLALLVFALGKLASESIFGEPINVSAGVPSGFRGGDLEHPPGLYLFNQARKRLGFVQASASLEIAQGFLLQASYLEANARHLEFWSAVVSASTSIQMLIKCQNFEWSSPTGDMHSRVFWTCLFHEDLYHLDLDLPSTGIEMLEDQIPLPFSTTQSNWDGTHEHVDDQHSYHRHHFLAMISLRRLISRIHQIVHEPLSTQQAESEESADVPVVVVREMARQLESWRSLLPAALQWHDSSTFQSPVVDPDRSVHMLPLFFTGQASGSIDHNDNLDMLTAQLRSRFYYARYILYRPFVYKALHFPDLMTAADADSCAIAINSMCLWPSLMSPPKLKKRLVPHLFTWTQNSLGVLIIFKMMDANESFGRILSGRVDRDRIRETSALILDWINDARQLDGVAEWAWTVVQPLFA